MTNVLFDEANLAALTAKHHEAVTKGEMSFIFEGHKVLTQYAEYLIKYLNIKFYGDRT